MALGECISLEELDFFQEENTASNSVSCSGDTDYGHDILQSLREVNDDDTFSRVLSSYLPDTRANTIGVGDDLEQLNDSLVPFNEKVRPRDAFNQMQMLLFSRIAPYCKLSGDGS